jgi:hypothetical protein
MKKIPINAEGKNPNIYDALESQIHKTEGISNLSNLKLFSLAM